MSASWDGAVRLADADAKPGHYYVSVRDPRGRTALALGPFTQLRPGKDAHARALGRVQAVRRYVQEHDGSRDAPWFTFGTCRLPLEGNPPIGRLNVELAPTTTQEG